MLKHGEVNPLGAYGLRQLDFVPPHFVSVVIDPTRTTEKDIADWIWENLQGRFYVGPIDIAENGHYYRRVRVCFELPEELSYFSLSLNQI